MDHTPICPYCARKVDDKTIYCPRCGKTLQYMPLSTSIGKQLLMYTVSVFLAPLGIGWGIQYVKGKTKKEKIIGVIILSLNGIAIIGTIITVMALMKQYGRMLDSISNLH